MKTDKETKKVLSDGERIKATMETPGWGVIEKVFFEYLNALDSVQNITETDPAKIADLVLVNQQVYKKMELFWGDITGEAEFSGENSELFDDEDDSVMSYQE